MHFERLSKEFEISRRPIVSGDIDFKDTRVNRFQNIFTGVYHLDERNYIDLLVICCIFLYELLFIEELNLQ